MSRRNLPGVPMLVSKGTRAARVRHGVLVVSISVIAAASFVASSASLGSAPPFVPTALGPTDFLVSDGQGNHISVFDQNLVFKGFFDENLSISSFRGLDFLPNQHIVGLSLTTPPTVTEYDTSGAHISSFMSADLHGDPNDLKANKAPLPANFRLYFGQDCCAMGDSAPELNLSGTKIRGFGSNTYDGIAVLPGNVMWAGGLGLTSKIDVFDISSGSGTGNNIAPIKTINLDNMQVNVSSLFYSAVTNTVLMVEPGSGTVFERMTDGTFVRKFTAPMGTSLAFGVTRGPGNDVFASGVSGVLSGRIVRWHSDGTFVSSTDISSHVFGPLNIIWAGNNIAACTLTPPANQFANTGPGATMCCAVVNYPAPTTSGTCGTVTCSPASGSCFPVGTTTVNCSEPGGASCMFTVTVTDNTPPTIACPKNQAAVIPPNQPCVPVTFANPAVSDNCPGATVKCVPPSGSCFSPGTTTVTCTATDASNNTAKCSFTVTTFDVCVQDDHTGDFLQWNSMTGDYIFTHCGVNGFTVNGKGTVSFLNGIRYLQDRKPNIVIANTGFNTGQLTGHAAVSVTVGPGIYQTFNLNQTSTHPTCACP